MFTGHLESICILARCLNAVRGRVLRVHSVSYKKMPSRNAWSVKANTRLADPFLVFPNLCPIDKNVFYAGR
jgi:hypothetical protein